MQIEAIDLKVGVKTIIDGEIFVVTDYFHGRTAQRRANVRVKLKSLKTGRVQEKTYSSHEKVERADTSNRTMQFLYSDSEYHFMDTETYDQVAIPGDVVGDAAHYLVENMEVPVLYHGDSPLVVDLPSSVALRVVETDPGLRGDSVSNVTKQAKMETGLVIQVPLFIGEGERLKVDTRTGEYIERA